MAGGKLIAVVGATGAQGRSLCDAILNDADGAFSCRAITRNPLGEQARALAARGAHVVAADLDDEASLARAFAGAHGIFGVTNYPEIFAAVGEDAVAREQQQATNIESLWFDDELAATQAMASAGMQAVMEDARRFADVANTRQLLAREVVMRDVPETQAALKLVTFNFRKPGMSPQRFQQYWQEQHGALVLRNFAALRRYVQNQALLSQYERGAEPDFDGVLEAWLASFEALRAGEGTPEHEAVRADEANFLDPNRFRFMFVRETRFR